MIADRLARAGEEAEGMGQYDYILVNDTVEECVDHLHQIIVSEHSRVSRNAEFIADIQKTDKSISEMINMRPRPLKRKEKIYDTSVLYRINRSNQYKQ